MRDVKRYLGVDLGAETIKIAELFADDSGLRPGRTLLAEHRKDPAGCLKALLGEFKWRTAVGIAATGRGSRLFKVSRVPTRVALERGARLLLPDLDILTLVSIGSHGFGVLERRGENNLVYHENNRCSQGTGNFLRQLVERFDLTVEEASALAAGAKSAASLSGRCPVILKTDMTHLANKGGARQEIIAGLYDAVCENVQVLVKARLAPRRVVLLGGVALAPRVRRNFARFLEQRGMELVTSDPHELRFMEALGAAVVATEGEPTRHDSVADIDDLVNDSSLAAFEQLPPLSRSIADVHRMTAAPIQDSAEPRDVVLGFDIGSTGSKMQAICLDEQRPLWSGYLSTLGDPVSAARRLAGRYLEESGGHHRVRLIGATGSGREIVGSLMSACYDPTRVFILNEIAAHSRGALSFDPKVDTIFEIGGQDAKYIRLEGGRVSDAAMNEACSAGTGSFIEEQGSKFDEVADVVQMGRLALDSDHGISLGQHCSVFMAEVIDEAVASGVPTPSILAGIYDSIVQNYLNRVKGSRSVGKRIFCQGMPFASDALAAAVARQTGRTVIVPPDPGTIGALGIALLARDELWQERAATNGHGQDEPLDLNRFLTAEVMSKDTFVCKSKKGCGGAGNRCRIDRLKAEVAGQKLDFVWGGGCSLWDKHTRGGKLPLRAPDPFRERMALVRQIDKTLRAKRATREAAGAPRRPLVAMTDEFSLKGLLPFFATFLDELGFEVRIHSDAGQPALKRGIEEATVPFCAPMQLYQGVVAQALEEEPDFFFAPRLRDLPRQQDEFHAVTCPIVQGSPEILAHLFAGRGKTKILRDRIDMGPGNLDSERFRHTTRLLAVTLAAEEHFERAFAAAKKAQRGFEDECQVLGARALEFARKHGIVPVVVLGRAYTIYNDVLNSNVPALLRSQGAMAIPVDCYQVAADTPVFPDLFWGYSQANVRAAHNIRRTDDVYAFFCSNYSCGPDSFSLHFTSYIMEGKPFAVVETDGHSGDAGTKTRIEAFLYCVEGDRRAARESRQARRQNDFKALEVDKVSISDTRRRGDLLLIPRMGPGAEVLAALFNSEGYRAEALPLPTRDHLRLGRRYTSGKECLPMVITLGSLLARVEEDTARSERFAFFMPTADGPCRFGVYNLLHKIVLAQTGHSDRVRICCPSDQDYFSGVSHSFRFRVFAAFVANDVLLAALHHVRPVETRPGAAQEIYDRYFTELKALMLVPNEDTVIQALGELPNGMFGVRNLVRRAAREFQAVTDQSRDLPTVAVVGEIYVRLDPFANDFVVEKLEERGLRALVAPFGEWLEYTTYTEMQRIRELRAIEGDNNAAARFTYAVEIGVLDSLYREMGEALGWPSRTSVEESIEASRKFLDPELMGEAVLTLGGPIHEHLSDHIDGVVSVGPHECMPNKIAEAQFAHAREHQGLISLTLPLNGDPIDPEVLDGFAFEVREHHRARRERGEERPERLPLPLEALGRIMAVARQGGIPAAKLRPLEGRTLMNALKVLGMFR